MPHLFIFIIYSCNASAVPKYIFSSYETVLDFVLVEKNVLFCFSFIPLYLTTSNTQRTAIATFITQISIYFNLTELSSNEIEICVNIFASIEK